MLSKKYLRTVMKYEIFVTSVNLNTILTPVCITPKPKNTEVSIKVYVLIGIFTYIFVCSTFG